MNSKECLDLAILEYEKETVYDKNNQWVKNVLKGLKEIKQYLEQLEKEKKKVETRLSSKETNTFDEIATMIKKANDYDVLVNKCMQLEKENQKLKNTYVTLDVREYCNELFDLQDENTKLKKALDILKEKLDIKLEVYHSGGCTLNHKIIPNCVTSNERCLRYLEVEEYELLKEVFENE